MIKGAERFGGMEGWKEMTVRKQGKDEDDNRLFLEIEIRALVSFYIRE